MKAPPERSLELAATLPDDEVVARVQAGEVALFELLMRRHNDRIYRTARAVVHDEDEAEDVMQEAYVRAWTHLDQYRGGGRFPAWLTRIALHEAFARVRRRLPTIADGLEDAGGSLMPQPSPAPRPEQAVLSAELRSLIERAVERLPEPQRLVFVLRDVQGLSIAETAESLELSEANVKVRLHRARARLRESLEAGVQAACPELFAFHRPRCDRVVAAVLARIGAQPGG